MGHLTKTERHRIEQLLRQQKNFQEIATALSRPRSTIMREVLKHRQAKMHSCFAYFEQMLKI